MIVGLFLAMAVSFAAGFVLNVGAFAVFAFFTSLLYLVVTFESGAIVGSLVSTIVLFVIMQVAYVVGVLVPFPFSRLEGRGFGFLKLRGRIDSHRNKSG